MDSSIRLREMLQDGKVRIVPELYDCASGLFIDGDTGSTAPFY